MGTITLKICSGLHRGADIELADGVWVFGRDDSADIILADEGLMRRHAALAVSEDGVRFEKLDGDILDAAGKPVAGGALAAGELWRMGGVLMAWGPADAPPSFWQALDASLAGLASPPAAQAAGDDKSEDAGDETSEERPEETPEAPSDEEASAGGGARKPSGEAGRILRAFSALVLVLALLAGLISAATFTFSRGARESAHAWLAEKSPAVLAHVYEPLFETGGFANVRRYLERAGLTGRLPGPDAQALRETLEALVPGRASLAVARHENGAYEVTGVVESDAERAAVLRHAKGLEWPVVIDVAVASDYVGIYGSAFRVLGFSPRVSVKRSGRETLLCVAGYMSTKDVEEKAFADVLRTVGTDGVAIERRIVHAESLGGLYREAFEKAGLKGVSAEFGPGAITVRAAPDAAGRASLEKVLAEVEARAGVPLPVTIADAPVQKAAPQKAKAAAKSGAPAFRVTAVSGGALKFVTLSSGEKVFVGGRLPGGWKLEAVKPDRLVLSRGRERINYALKEKK